MSFIRAVLLIGAIGGYSIVARGVELGQCITPVGIYGVVPCDDQCIGGSMRGGAANVSALYAQITSNFTTQIADTQSNIVSTALFYAGWLNSLSSEKDNLNLLVQRSSSSIVSSIQARVLQNASNKALEMKVTTDLQNSLMNSLKAAIAGGLKIWAAQKELNSRTTPEMINKLISTASEIYTVGDWYKKLYNLERKIKAISSMNDLGSQIYVIALEKTRTELINDISDINTAQSTLLPKINGFGLLTSSITEKRVILLKQEKNNILEQYVYRQAIDDFISTL